MLNAVPHHKRYIAVFSKFLHNVCHNIHFHCRKSTQDQPTAPVDITKLINVLK